MTDSGHSFSGSFSEPGPVPPELLKSAALMRFQFTRPWLERLFSRPWRPWLNGWEYAGDVRVSLGEDNTDEDTQEVTHTANLRGEGPLTKRIVRF